MSGAQLEGGCACGAVRYRLTSEPLFVHCCHCLNCQRQTGSGDKNQTIRRCPSCEVALYSDYGSPRVWFVRAGTLDDPAAVAPDVHIYTRSKLPWVELPESVPAFDVYYDSKKLWPAASLERLGR